VSQHDSDGPAIDDFRVNDLRAHLLLDTRGVIEYGLNLGIRDALKRHLLGGVDAVLIVPSPRAY
jgi:hypothetical protein